MTQATTPELAGAPSVSPEAGYKYQDNSLSASLGDTLKSKGASSLRGIGKLFGWNDEKIAAFLTKLWMSKSAVVGAKMVNNIDAIQTQTPNIKVTKYMDNDTGEKTTITQNLDTGEETEIKN